jgi:hypothetical protein
MPQGEPIGYFQGRPVYEEGGVQVVGPNGAAPNADGNGGSSGDNDLTDTDESSTDTGQDSGGTGTAGTEGGTTEGTPPASSVDESSSDGSSGQQGQGPDVENLKKALAAERQQRKDLANQVKDLKKQNATAEERALLEARESSATEAEARVKPPLIRALAAAELRAAGVQGSTSKLVGLLSLDKIELDDDGEPIGLSDQIDELRSEFPNLFMAASGNGRPLAGSVNAGSGSRSGRTKDANGNTAPKPWYEQLADQVLNPASASGAGVSMR